MRADCRLAAEPESVPAARRFVTDALAGWPAESLHEVALMVSEVATNCVMHARTEFTLVLVRTGRVVQIELTDDGDGLPEVATPDETDPHGRGLRIVDQLATAWGVESARRSSGKTLWFSLLAPGNGHARERSA